MNELKGIAALDAVIATQEVEDDNRPNFLVTVFKAPMFGVKFENMVYPITDRMLLEQYNGGWWGFHTIEVQEEDRTTTIPLMLLPKSCEDEDGKVTIHHIEGLTEPVVCSRELASLAIGLTAISHASAHVVKCPPEAQERIIDIYHGYRDLLYPLATEEGVIDGMYRLLD